MREARVVGSADPHYRRGGTHDQKRPEMDGDSIVGAIMKGDVVGTRDARLNQIIHDITGWAQRRWTAEDSPNLVTYEIIELAYSYPKRAHDLIESMRALMQTDRVVPAVILARALVETIAMGRYFIDKMEKSLSDGDFSRLEAHFFRFYAGSKLGEAKIKSVHVNDALRELESADVGYVSHLVNKYPFLWSMAGPNPTEALKGQASLLQTYDKLSEISHPKRPGNPIPISGCRCAGQFGGCGFLSLHDWCCDLAGSSPPRCTRSDGNIPRSFRGEIPR